MKRGSVPPLTSTNILLNCHVKDIVKTTQCTAFWNDFFYLDQDLDLDVHQSIEV